MSRMIGKLPASAEALLKAAAATGTPGSLARRVAIDRALDRVAEDYPEHFRTEKRETNMKLIIKNVRVGFLQCFKAQPPQAGDGPPKFGVKVVVPEDHPQIKEIDAAMLSVAETKWPGKGKATLDKMVKTGKPKNIEVAFVKEPYANADGDVYDGFEDAYYLSATAGADKRPLVIDADRTPLIEADGRPYSGCICNVQVEFWPQDNKFGKAIRAELKAVQFVRDGDAFSGGGVPAKPDDFDDVSGGADAAGLA